MTAPRGHKNVPTRLNPGITPSYFGVFNGISANDALIFLWDVFSALFCCVITSATE